MPPERKPIASPWGQPIKLKAIMVVGQRNDFTSCYCRYGPSYLYVFYLRSSCRVYMSVGLVR